MNYTYTQLTEIKRYLIKAFLKVSYSKKAPKDELNRHPSTIDSELLKKSRIARLTTTVWLSGTTPYLNKSILT